MIKNLFPSQIYYAKNISKNAKQLNKDLLSECEKFAQIDDKGLEWSKKNYIGGYTSYGSLAQMWTLSSTFNDLKKELDKHTKKYIKALSWDVDPKSIQMTSLWINIMPTTVTHSWHIHPHSAISGTYYVKTPKNCSAIKFEDPRIRNFMNTPTRCSDAAKEHQWHYQVKPEAGHIVLFESWMSHEVPPNQAKDERVSISFNYDWIRN